MRELLSEMAELMVISDDLLSSAFPSSSGTAALTGMALLAFATVILPMRDSPSMVFFLELR